MTWCRKKKLVIKLYTTCFHNFLLANFFSNLLKLENNTINKIRDNRKIDELRGNQFAYKLHISQMKLKIN